MTTPTISPSHLLDDLIQSNTTAPYTDSSNEDAAVSITLPLIFRAEYDIFFWGLERCHPFDTAKWGRVARLVQARLTRTAEQGDRAVNVHLIAPNHPMTTEELSLVHSDEFLHALKHSKRTIVNTSEVCLLYLLPMCTIEAHLLRPLQYQTTGTIVASLVALKCKAAVNLGGGFHHCSARRSGGFCFFADITLVVRYLWDYCAQEHLPPFRILIVDCDAHQGNGYARDVLLMGREEQRHVYILDLYNPRIYPRDEAAKAIVNREVLLPKQVQDEEYLRLLNYHLKATIDVDKFKADFIIYNAGTDILIGDRLGRLQISPEGILQRDHVVFAFAQQHDTPIVMLTSGGYQQNNAQVIADSIVNLVEEKLIKPVNVFET